MATAPEPPRVVVEAPREAANQAKPSEPRAALPAPQPPLAAAPRPEPQGRPALRTGPTEAARPAPPRFDVARLGRNGMLVAAGRAQPGSEVTLLDNGREIGRGRADVRGEWVILPDAPLGPGARELTLMMRPPGGEPIPGEASVVLLPPEPAPALAAVPPSQPEATREAAVGDAASAETPAAREERVAEATPRRERSQGEASAPHAAPGPLALLVPQAQAAPVVALQTPSRARLALDLVDYGMEGDIRFAGSAPPGSVVRLYVNGRHLGDATSDAAGRWSFAAGGRLPPGRYTMRVDQLDAQGRVASRVEQPFLREPPPVIAAAAAAAPESRHIVQPGHTLWRIARENYGRGTRFTLIYAANREQIRDPHRIFPGQVFALPAPGDSSRSR